MGNTSYTRAARRRGLRNFANVCNANGGRIKIVVFRDIVHVVLEFVLRGFTGAGEHGRHLMAIKLWLSTAFQMSRAGDAPLCIGCDHAFADAAPASFVIMEPITRDAPTRVCVSGVCRACESKADADLARQAIVYWGGNAKDINVIASPGRA